MSQSIQIPIMALKPAIAGLSKIISKRTTLPILGSVKITRRASGELSFEGTDLDALAIYTTEATKGGKDSTILVSFEALSTVTKRTHKDAFVEVIAEKHHARIRYPAGGSWIERPIETFKEDEWPVIPLVTKPSSLLTMEFQKTFITALDCASDHKPDLTGGWLDVNDPKAHYVVGSDGHQLFTANSFKFDLKESLLIPAHKFLHWSGFVEDGQWSLRVGELDKNNNGWTQIQSACWTLLIKQSKARCPTWKQVIPADIKTHVTFSDEAVAALLDVLPKLPGGAKINHDVTFDLGPKGTIVRGSENGHSSQVTVSGVCIDGDPNTFAADRTLIIKALRLGLKDMAVVDGLSPIVFSDPTRRLVIAPLRSDPTPATSSAAPVQPPTTTASSEPTTINQEQEGEPVKTTNRITQATTTTSNGTSEMEQQPENSSPLKQAMQKVDQIKESLRDTQADLNDLLKLLGQANRDQRSTEKEVEEVRDALQSLQKIRI
jgi:DNA polymerase III sliding clamp (beta) subunit (PCNA family)